MAEALGQPLNARGLPRQRVFAEFMPSLCEMNSACRVCASLIWNRCISIPFWWEVVKHEALSMPSSATASINYLRCLCFGYLRMIWRFGTYVFIKRYSDLVVLRSWLLLNKERSKTGRQTKERLLSGVWDLQSGRHRGAGIRNLFQKQGEMRRAYRGKEETSSKAT